MEYYLLEESMRSCTAEELHGQSEHKYVAVLTTPEWQQERDRFDMGIDLEPDAGNIHNTKAEVNYDSLTGTFQIPDRKNIREGAFCLHLLWMKRGSCSLTTAARRNR